MKRTIAYLSLMLAFTFVAFGQTSQLKAATCGTCCSAGCGQTCCPDGCGSCCQGK
jgi:hypothetical protein